MNSVSAIISALRGTAIQSHHRKANQVFLHVGIPALKAAFTFQYVINASLKNL